MTIRDKYLRHASTLLSLGAMALLLASAAMLADSIDLQSRVGRHLLAGTLANTSLAIVMFLVARKPIRLGERWAFWAYVIPLFVYGIPILAVDIRFVQPENLWITITPQLVGLGLLLYGLALAFVGMYRKG